MSKSVKINVIYQIIYQLIMIIVPIITMPYVSSKLGAELIGDNSYAVTIANYFVIFSMLGLNNLGTRKISMIKHNRNELNKTFSGLFILHIFITIPVIISYCLLCVFYNFEKKYLLIINGIAIITSLVDINWFFFGLEKFKITVTRNLIIKVISVIAIFIFVKDKNDLWIYALILVITNLFSNLYLWVIVFKEVSFVRVEYSRLKSYIKPLFILFIPVIAVSVFRYMDKIMLGVFMENNIELGYYEQSDKIITVGVSVVTAIGTVMLPHCSSLFSQGKDKEALFIIKQSNLFSAFASCGVAFGLITIRHLISTVYLPVEFEKCEDVILVLSISIIFISIANVVRTHYLIPKSKDTIYVLSAIIGAVINFIFNLFFIRKFGAVGAAIGTLAAELMVAIIQVGSCKKELPIFKMIIEYIPFMFFGILMIFLTPLLTNRIQDGWIKLILQIIVGGGIYAILSTLYFVLLKKEYLKIKKDKKFEKS